MWFPVGSYFSVITGSRLWKTYPCACYGWQFGDPNRGDHVIFSQSSPSTLTPFYHLTVLRSVVQPRYVVDLFADDGTSGFHGSDLGNIGGLTDFNVAAGVWVNDTTRKVYAIGITDPNPESDSVLLLSTAFHSAIGAEIHSIGSDFHQGELYNVVVWNDKDPGEEALQHLVKGHQHPYFVKPKGMVAWMPLQGYMQDYFLNDWAQTGPLKSCCTSWRIPKRLKTQRAYGRWAVGRRAEGRPMTGV